MFQKKNKRERKLIDNESSLIDSVMCIDLDNQISMKNLKKIKKKSNEEKESFTSRSVKKHILYNLCNRPKEIT